MSSVYHPMDHTPEEWREMARESRARAAESWERSDTDGFLSQWAAGKVASDYDYIASIAERGGRSEFLALTDLDGNLLDARYIQTKYGWSWMIRNADGTTSWFNESHARSGEKRRKAHEAKGYRIVHVLREALVGHDGHAFPVQDSPVESVREIEYRDH